MVEDGFVGHKLFHAKASKHLRKSDVRQRVERRRIDVADVRDGGEREELIHARRDPRADAIHCQRGEHLRRALAVSDVPRDAIALRVVEHVRHERGHVVLRLLVECEVPERRAIDGKGAMPPAVHVAAAIA